MVGKDVFKHAAPDLDLSVIVPCYNVERYVAQCLDSLLCQQTQYAFEVIAVNDGATDGTGRILDEYASRFDTLHVINRENGGLAAARNTGIREARGRYLTFVDSDDYVSDGFIESAMATAIRENADVVATGQISFDESREYKKLMPHDDHDRSVLTGTAWGKMFKRELLARVVFPEGYWFEDTPLRHLIYPRIDRYASVCDCSYMYRHNLQGINLSSKGKPKALDTVYITDLVFRHVEKIAPQGYLDGSVFRAVACNQFYLNQCRIEGLPKACRKLVFRIQSDFYHTHLKSNGPSTPVNSPLYVTAMSLRSFTLAKISVKAAFLNRAVKVLGRLFLVVKKHNS
nr:glycosyltransferase [Bifidobacterium reuteri]